MSDNGKLPDHIDVNVAMAQALGLKDVRNLRRVELVLEPHGFPRITATYIVCEAGAVRDVVCRYGLVPLGVVPVDVAQSLADAPPPAHPASDGAA